MARMHHLTLLSLCLALGSHLTSADNSQGDNKDNQPVNPFSPPDCITSALAAITATTTIRNTQSVNFAISLFNRFGQSTEKSGVVYGPGNQLSYLGMSQITVRLDQLLALKNPMGLIIYVTKEWTGGVVGIWTSTQLGVSPVNIQSCASGQGQYVTITTFPVPTPFVSLIWQPDTNLNGDVEIRIITVDTSNNVWQWRSKTIAGPLPH